MSFRALQQDRQATMFNGADRSYTRNDIEKGDQIEQHSDNKLDC